MDPSTHVRLQQLESELFPHDDGKGLRPTYRLLKHFQLLTGVPWTMQDIVDLFELVIPKNESILNPNSPTKNGGAHHFA